MSQKVHFLGPDLSPQPATYLAEADILVSPRIKGSNTPMNLYSYLHSGKAMVGYHLRTHTQILDSRVAVLAKPAPQAFCPGMLSLVEDATRRQILGNGWQTVGGREVQLCSTL